MYKPQIGEQVIVDFKVLKKPKARRTGSIINKVQSREGKGQYELSTLIVPWNVTTSS